MQSDQQFSPNNKAGLDPGNRPVDTYMHAPVASSLNPVFPPGAKHLAPFHGFEFCPSEVCPKNFIIFDQNDNRSQIMFHPGIAHKFSAPSFNFHATCSQANNEGDRANGDEDDDGESSYPLEEDSDDIDALLSSEDGEQDGYEYNEEEVSTARTHGDYGSMSPDSFSSYSSKPSNSGGNSRYDYERKQRKMKQMVKALRGIVPGGDQMNNTVAVIDEAVRYLKSLKVEVQKLGVENLRD